MNCRTCGIRLRRRGVNTKNLTAAVGMVFQELFPKANASADAPGFVIPTSVRYSASNSLFGFRNKIRMVNRSSLNIPADLKRGIEVNAAGIPALQEDVLSS